MKKRLKTVLIVLGASRLILLVILGPIFAKMPRPQGDRIQSKEIVGSESKG